MDFAVFESMQPTAAVSKKYRTTSTEIASPSNNNS